MDKDEIHLTDTGWLPGHTPGDWQVCEIEGEHVKWKGQVTERALGFTLTLKF